MRWPRATAWKGSLPWFRLTMLAVVCTLALPAQRKPKEQTLQLPRDLPNSVSGQTARLSFHVTPLTNKGLLSAQVRDALKALGRQTGSGTVLKIRAFVAGSGDVRRVRDLVSEVFTERHQPLPALSLVRCGGLPLEGAQVELEAVAQGRKELNPRGLAFLSAIASDTDPLPALRRQVQAAGAEPAGVVRVTCFFHSLEALEGERAAIAAEYPQAARTLVQTERASARPMAACEAVARPKEAVGARMSFPAVDGIASEAGQSPVVVVGAPEVVLTGMQISFGATEADSRLAFGRLLKELAQSGLSAREVAFVHYYPLSAAVAAGIRKIRAEVFDAAHPPAGTLLEFEGLPSMDAGFALDVVAVK